MNKSSMNKSSMNKGSMNKGFIKKVSMNRRGKILKYFLFIVFILQFLLMSAGCGTRGTEKEEVRTGRNLVIGFSQLGSESAWRLGNTKSMEEAAEKYGFSLMMKNGMQKQEKQIDAIRSFIAYQVDVIVFAPIV